MTARTLAVALLAAVLLPVVAPAQQPFAFTPRTQFEMRDDITVARHPAALVMVGANMPFGYYVRAGGAVGAGILWRDDAPHLAMRADATIRFLLDPFAENIWGPYAGGGFTIRRDAWDRPVAGLLLVLGVEGRRGKKWLPSYEAALGQGARVAVVLRKARRNGR